MDTSSVSKQERQSLEAVSRSESAMFPLDKPESEDLWSPVLFELPVTASSLGLAGPLMGLKEGLEDSCLCQLEPIPDFGVKLDQGSTWQGMSGREDTSREVPGGGVRPLEGPGTGKP